MGGKELLLGIFTILFLTSATMLVFGDDVQESIEENPTMKAGDPLIQEAVSYTHLTLPTILLV